MRYLSVCSGIEAATVAWHPLGWTPAAFSEIEKFPSALLAHHYPHVPNLGDMTKFKEWPDATVDLLVGGTPCQSFSVAGLRKGLADPRGNLALTYLAIAARYSPEWLVWENVPGVLSDGDGAFWQFLDGLSELGYGWAWRVLDAQFFGVAQRRRRVFVVGYLGDWRRAASVLFERESLRGNPPPSREQGKGLAASSAPSLTASGRGVERTGESRGQDPVIAVVPALTNMGHHGYPSDRGDGAHLVPDISLCLNAGGMGRIDAETETMIPMTLASRGRDGGHQLETRQDGTANAILTPSGGRGGIGVGAVAFNARQDPDSWEGRTGPLDTDGCTQAVAFDQYNASEGEVMGTMCGMTHHNRLPSLRVGMQVRRLTPRECERLQGFPDDYTLIPYRGKPAADGPRYKALGNSMAVPVMRWIGERIADSVPEQGGSV